jgi:uncharacterized protein HemX
MSDDGFEPEPWAAPETIAAATPRRKQRWGIVAIVVILGLALVGGAFFYRRQQRDDLADAKRTRNEAAARLKDAQRDLAVADSRYAIAKGEYERVRASAKALTPAADGLAAKATTATEQLASYADLTRTLTQAWLDGRYVEFNRLVGEANARLDQVRDATNTMRAAALAIVRGGTSTA